MILVTGGSGYIGSHTCVELLRAGYDLAVIDNLCNSSTEPIERLVKITGKRVEFINCDIRNKEALRSIFTRFEIQAVIHFAGLKSVGESVTFPLRYFDNNVTGSLTLFEVMAEFGCKRVVFSSSATVYGDPISVPIKEDFPLLPTNPYGTSKLMVENILRDLAISDQSWCAVILRYFNPVGAHPSGYIGEDPNGPPNNLLPYISQVAIGKLSQLSVFGNDYATPDGTGIRDYIHVVDLAQGHLCALQAVADRNRTGAHVYNLGTGQGYSVLQMLRAFEAISSKRIPYRIAPRRPGDIAICYSDPTKAERELGWKARRGLDEMISDAWHWQSMNPSGYR